MGFLFLLIGINTTLLGIQDWRMGRHLNTPIELEIHRKVKVYRLLSLLNDNSSFQDWDKTNIKVGIRGSTCVHTEVVTKVFFPGKVILESGGPLTSSPILIKELNDSVPSLPISIKNINIKKSEY